MSTLRAMDAMAQAQVSFIEARRDAGRGLAAAVAGLGYLALAYLELNSSICGQQQADEAVRQGLQAPPRGGLGT